MIEKKELEKMKHVFYFTVLLICVSGCAKIKENKLQGKWVKSNPAYHPGDSLQFEFSCDNFYLRWIAFADTVGLDPSPCNSELIKMYAKGDYSLKGKKITFNGVYCDSSFIPLNPQTTLCYSVGQYFQDFDIECCDETFNMDQHLYFLK